MLEEEPTGIGNRWAVEGPKKESRVTSKVFICAVEEVMMSFPEMVMMGRRMGCKGGVHRILWWVISEMPVNHPSGDNK